MPLTAALAKNTFWKLIFSKPKVLMRRCESWTTKTVKRCCSSLLSYEERANYSRKALTNMNIDQHDNKKFFSELSLLHNKNTVLKTVLNMVKILVKTFLYQALKSEE